MFFFLISYIARTAEGRIQVGAALFFFFFLFESQEGGSAIVFFSYIKREEGTYAKLLHLKLKYVIPYFNFQAIFIFLPSTV